MGVALWLLCGVAVFIVARAIGAARPARFIGELTLALIAAFAAGLLASALDFGGWSEVDWRAGAFVISVVFAAIGISRAARLMSGRATQH